MEKLTDTKILFVITKSNLGGAQKYVLELARAAKNRGGLVTVAVGGTGEKDSNIGPLGEQLKQNGIRAVFIKSLMRNMSAITDMRAFFEILTIIRKERPDVLHVTSSKAGGLGALAGRICRVKTIIFTSHGLTFDETWRPTHQKIAIKLLTWGTLVLAHQSIMISKDTYEKTRKFLWVHHKVHLIYNGVRQKPQVSKKDAREILSPLMDTPRAIWVGGIGELHPNKNWILLIEAMTKLPKNVHCVIIGGGEQRELLQKSINERGLQDRVLLKGFIQDASLLLSAYDVFVLPSSKEGLPYVLLEAGLSKCAVVCSNISGNTDIIRDAENGILIDQTKENLVAAITRLIENPSERKRYGLALYETVTTKFAMCTMIDTTQELYRT